MAEEPKLDISALMTAAISMHELWKTYVDAGFTEQQALYLVGCLFKGLNG